MKKNDVQWKQCTKLYSVKEILFMLYFMLIMHTFSGESKHQHCRQNDHL